MRLIGIVLLFSVAGLAQHGRAVRAGVGGPNVTPTPRVKAEPGPKAKPAPDVPKTPGVGKDVLGQMERHPQLATRLQPLLPEGTPLDAAATGFKNTGQFIAALHVSKNLGIPFADLKTMMTGPEAKSLGASIRTLKPDVPEEQVKVETERATEQAKADEREVRNMERHKK